MSKKQTFQLQMLSPVWGKKLKNWAKLGAPFIVGLIVLGIYAEVNQTQNDAFMVITKFFDAVIPILVLMAVFGNFGKIFKNANLTLKDGELVYKEKNKVKWKITVKDITSIFEQVDPNTKRIKTLFVTPQKNFEPGYGIVKKEQLYSAIRLHNPTVHIKEIPSSTLHDLTSPETSEGQDASSKTPEEILRIAIFAVAIITILVYFFFKN